MAVRRAESVVWLGLLWAVAGCRSVANEQAELTAVLGQDPAALLRALAADEPAAGGLCRRLREAWGGAMELRVLRFGLGHDDERVVLGATKLLEGGPGPAAPVPELRHAASIVLPRLGEPDCPLGWEETLAMIGSRDFAALGPALRRLPEADACNYLGNLHRVVRADSIPPLCVLARATDGAVRNDVWGNACLAAAYSAEHTPLLVETWLALVGRTPGPRTANGLPAVLSAALHAAREQPWESSRESGEPDRLRPGFPGLTCSRWLLASRPGPADLPMLRQLLTAEAAVMRHAAVWSLGAMDDESSWRLLRGPVPEGVEETCWTAARARRGDGEALEALFAGDDGARAFALALASPERRRRFCEQLLARPVAESLDVVGELGEWARGDLHGGDARFVLPHYDDRYLAEFEPVIAAAPDLDVRLVRAFVDQLPACETGRLADALLARSADELLSGGPELPGSSGAEGQIGHAGVWAFLEVTRPGVFRERLRQGLDSEHESVRDAAARMLIRLGDIERLDALVAWIDDGGDDGHEPLWLHLARDGGTKVRQRLHDRVAGSAPHDVDEDLLRALAVASGMPLPFARQWQTGNSSGVREALLAGDAPAAFLCSPGAPGAAAVSLLVWRRPGVSAFVLASRAVEAGTALDASEIALERALALDDRATLHELLEPLRDGRYATHDDAVWSVAARAGGLAQLPFWIDQLGSNCCKAVYADGVFEDLFGQGSRVFDRCQHAEPAAVFLRRTLLPVADRLRWSRIASSYVVAGQ